MSSPVINMSSVAPKYFKMHKQAKYKLKNSGCCCNPKLQLKLTPLNSTLSQAKGKKHSYLLAPLSCIDDNT